EGAGLSRDAPGPAGGRRGERPGERQGRAPHGGLPFGLSSEQRVVRSRPLAGDGSLAMPRVYIEAYGCQVTHPHSEPELRVLGRAGYRAAPGAAVTFKSWEHYEDVPPVRETAATAYVTVQRGCDYRCTFCIVPMTRGPERSRKLTDVVREVSDLARTGTTEVTLLGQTVNSYY